MSEPVPQVEEIILNKEHIGLGFNIRGGLDNLHIGTDPGIFVTTIKPGLAAAQDGRLNPGDKILEINGQDLRNVTHQTAVLHFHDSGNVVTLLVEKGAEDRIKRRMIVRTSDLVKEVPYAGPPSPTPPDQVEEWEWSKVLLGVGVAGVLTAIATVATVLYIRRRH